MSSILENTMKRPLQQDILLEEPEGKRGKKDRMACNQTGVAVLQELCMKRKWNPPMYDVVNLGGPANEPMFEVTVTVSCGINNITASGTGRQKKAAKHAAALKALDHLQEKALTDGSDVYPSDNSEKKPTNPHEEVGTSNAIGQLQELCASKRLPSPVYTLIGDEGEPHEKVFTIQCSVSSMRVTGIAKKKQHAKHLAAQNMLEHFNTHLKQILEEIPNDPAVSTMRNKEALEQEREQDLDIIEKFKNIKDTRDDFPIAPQISPGVKFSSYHQDFKKQLEELQEILDKPIVKQENNAEKKLELVAHDLNLTLNKTVDVGKDKSFIVFMQLNTNPTTVQAGHASNEAAATNQAANMVLDFLKIMSS